MHLLRELPALRRLCLARALSGLGDGVTLTALTLLLAPDGAGAVAGVLLAGAVPRVLGPVTGALADRADPRRVMTWSCAAGAACLAVLALLELPLAAVLVLVGLAALAATCFGPAYRTSVPLLVPADRLAEANAVNGAASQLSVLLGAAAGGGLVAVTSPRSALLVDVLAFVAAALLVRGLPQLRPAVAPAALAGQVREGLAYARSQPAVRALLVAMFLLVAFAGVDNVALVFLVTDELGGGAVAFGALSAVFGVGMLAASLGLLRRTPADPMRLLLAGCLLSSAGTALSGLAPGLAVLVAAQLVGGAGNAAVVVAAEGLLQRAVPHALLGRVGGAYQSAVQLAFVVAYAAGGPLTAWLGPRGVFLVAAAGSLLALPAVRLARAGAPAPG